MAEDSNTDVFIYTEGAAVPDEVVRVRVHPSVTVIPEGAFKEQYKLEEVELCEGLLEIRKCAFSGCVSLKRINIPSTVRIIRGYVFTGCKKMTQVELCEGLLEIGNGAFKECQALQKITIPSTVTEIKFCSFYECKGLEEVVLYEGNLQLIGVRAFSDTNIKRIKIPSSVSVIGNYAFAGCYKLAEVELCEGLQSIYTNVFRSCISLKHITIPTTVAAIEVGAFDNCKTLRDIAIPPNAEIQAEGVMASKMDAFYDCIDLKEVFDTEEQLIHNLKRRFFNLPIHKMIYYQSHEPQIESNRQSARLFGDDSSTHMACSTVQNIELYKVLIEKYPENLITKDRWGDVPLLYAVWGNAPDEIVQYLVESYKSIYPNHVFDWNGMIVTIFLAAAPLRVIQNLLTVQRESFPDQVVDWDQVFEMITISRRKHSLYSKDIFRLLVKNNMAERISSIGIKKSRDELTDMVNTEVYWGTTLRVWFEGVRSKLSKYEEKYNRLKAATTILELVLWKNDMNESDNKKKRKRTEKSDDDFREQCRISCGCASFSHTWCFVM